MKFLKGHRVFDNAYENYARAMSRRRPDSVLDSRSFYNYLDRDNVSAYVETTDKKITAVVGQTEHVSLDDEQFFIFKISHFAPATNRHGVDVLKKISKVTDKVIIFTVTEDLCDMLVGCGFVSTGISFFVNWGGDAQEKFVFTQKNNDLIVRSLFKNNISF